VTYSSDIAEKVSVRVNPGRCSYEIQIGRKNLSTAGDFLRSHSETRHVVLVTDENVRKYYAPTVLKSLARSKIAADMVVVKPGERSKSLTAAARLWRRLLELQADKRTVIVALGGGVVGDLAGFVAATYARGLPVLQLPTTLLAQVDSAIGGKTAVNLVRAKNIVGAFHQPIGVLADVTVLATLPERHYRTGLAEAVKYAVTMDAAFFDFLESDSAAISNRRPEVLIPLVAHCCRLKAGIVERDEREELSIRTVLNFGHTFAHAFETLSRFRLLHGEALSAGMVCAARLAQRRGKLGKDIVERLTALLQTFGLPTQPPPVEIAHFLALLKTDKKALSGGPRFVLPTRLGEVEVVENVELKEIRTVLKA